jgi:hypothetical protein
VDWYHAEEHLEIVAAAALSDLSQRAIWLEETTQVLWDGQVEDVIAACETLAQTCLQASQATTYFTNNMERMCYGRFRAAGYMIGSGTIESGASRSFLSASSCLALNGSCQAPFALQRLAPPGSAESGTSFVPNARLCRSLSDNLCVHTLLLAEIRVVCRGGIIFDRELIMVKTSCGFSL